ncbi:MAG: hypothetical protein NWF00_11740 [Candidatus Bathyarchaeota archaeon]|nr:hypothetical protein [Candidatus Bathyarchaeota archaeon]
MVHQLIVTIDDELKNAMSKYPDVDWVAVALKSFKDCIQRKELAGMYTGPVEKDSCT